MALRAGFALHHQIVTARGAAPSALIYILHGILGSGSNWRSFARKLAERRPDWGVALIDLREHGRSQGAPPPHTISTAAQDLRELAAVLEFDGKRVMGVCGHSFGGKVALRYRQLAAAELVTTWVIDSSPGADPNAMFAGAGQVDTTPEVLALLESLPRRFARRDDAVNELLARGAGTALAEWLAMNYELVPEPSRAESMSSAKRPDRTEVELRLDLRSIRAMLEDYHARDLWDAIDDSTLPGDLHVVVAGKSHTLSADDRDALAALAVRDPDRVFVHTIAEAGHWVHVDAPDRLLDLIASSLPAVPP